MALSITQQLNEAKKELENQKSLNNSYYNELKTIKDFLFGERGYNHSAKDVVENLRDRFAKQAQENGANHAKIEALVLENIRLWALIRILIKDESMTSEEKMQIFKTHPGHYNIPF